MKKITPLFILTLLSAIGCVSVIAQDITPLIVTDQFGYRPQSTKIAIIRDPQVGFDSGTEYLPAESFTLVNAITLQEVFAAEITPWNSGSTHTDSGDKIWWFDFSVVVEEGEYYVLDPINDLRSSTFKIDNHVYNEVLKAAFKAFYYQRAGFTKATPYAGAGWQDAASHLGPLQDANCRLFSDAGNAATERDLSGGWYDAGDYNKYTPWAANYIVAMLRMYHDHTAAWTDDFGIPESGNGISDMLDEIKWGMDWLLKMQQPDGGSLCVMQLDYASPPSSASAPSLYGPRTANATWRSASAFALGAKYFREADEIVFGAYADTLEARAVSAWNWAQLHPYAQFSNSEVGLAAGDQETDSLGRFTAKMSAALHLYALTGGTNYLDIFENNVTEFPLIAWGNYLNQYFQESQNLMFYYLTLPDIDNNIAEAIRSATLTATHQPGDYSEALLNQSDAYRTYINDYNWGSNQYKCDYGNYFCRLKNSDIDPQYNAQYEIAAEDYVHYIHGINAMQLVYLSHTAELGADNHIMEFYHSWFADGSALWDREGTSTYGPAPGYLSGGPNEFYQIDECCPNNCGSAENNALCNAESTSPPLNQPPMKSYKDFNTSWPIDSWQVTENSNGYQLAYLELLSKFVAPDSITGISETNKLEDKFYLYPNPCNTQVVIGMDGSQGPFSVEVYDLHGAIIFKKRISSTEKIDIEGFPAGVYSFKISDNRQTYLKRLVKI
jgi:endoglucanase